jgi:hypothetical protein
MLILAEAIVGGLSPIHKFPQIRIGTSNGVFHDDASIQNHSRLPEQNTTL